MTRPARALWTAVAWTAVALTAFACRASHPAPDTAHPPERPLAGMLAQQLLVAPVQSLEVAEDLGWTGLPRSDDLLRNMDTEITAAVTDRVAGRGWIFAQALEDSYSANSAYLTNPRMLGSQILKSTKPITDSRLTEPLASQVRAMIAPHDGRLVLIPVEMRIERTPTGQGRAVVKLVLVDGRDSEIKWIGDVRGDPAMAFGPALTASVASRIADLFAAP